MRTSTVDYSLILKRKIALDNYNEDSKDSQYLYSIARSSILESKNTVCIDTQKFFHNCTDFRNANRYYKKCVDILESTMNSPIYETLSTIFDNDIISEISDLDNLKEYVESSQISSVTKEKFLKTIREYKICDRVLNNTKGIKKRFDLEKIVRENRYLPIYKTVFECCSLLDTYNLPSYGKMNVALEQLSYYLQKNDIKYNKSELVSNISEYFLYTTKDNKAKTYELYESVLKDNAFIDDSDIADNPFIQESSTNNPVKNVICDYYKSGNERSEMECLEKIMELPANVLVDWFFYVLSYCRDYVELQYYDRDTLLSMVQYISDSIKELDLSTNQLEKIRATVGTNLALLDNLTSKNDNEYVVDKYDVLYKSFKDFAEDLDDMIGSNYPDEKIEDDEEYIAATESANNVVTLYEFKIFKFQNLIRAVFDIDKFLNRKGNKFVDIIKAKSKQIFNVSKKFFNESDVDLSNISSDGRFDMVISVYEVSDEKDLRDMHRTMTEMCRSINNSFSLPEGSRVSYTNYSNRFEVHLEDSSYIQLSPFEENKIEFTLSEYALDNAQLLEDTSIYLDNLFKCSSILESYEKLSIEKLLCLSEVLSYVDYTKDKIKDIVNEYSSNHNDDYIGNTKLNTLLESVDMSMNIPIDLQNEAMDIAKDILTEGVDLNKIKIAMEGIKKKVKDLGAKEKEMSRDMDIRASHFSNSVKQAMTNDRREAIIKGSVIPSFSKCIKAAIALAGIGLVGGPIAAVISAFVGLAISKNLTRKERSLMIDEIDIELKALDKEIGMAEDSKNMRKYRELLTYQKKLQREKQRIKYNIQAGRDLPDSNMGTAYQKD